MNANRHLAEKYMQVREDRAFYGEPKPKHVQPNSSRRKNPCKKYRHN